MSQRLEELKAALKGRYEIERELGHGGMATVYLAQDVARQREVAVKVLRPDLAAALGPDRFLREIRIAANLTHPHILPLHDSGEADGFLFYVMPYIKGQTLRDRIDKEGELPIAEAVRIIREVVDALAFAHSEGVVHRDIKPDNIMLTGGHAIVADFGVAKAVSEATGRDKLTTAGVALGTPAYMSPEQATADPHVDHRADIYAVGAMAYELLTGRTPFVGATPQSILAAHVTEQVEPVSKYRDHVSAELEALIMRCLEKKPADRWQSADEMLPHLESMGTSSGGLTPAATMPVAAVSGPKKFFNPTLFVGVAVLAVLGVFGSRMFTGNPPLNITISNQVPLTTNPELEYQPDISPAGEDVVYLSGYPGGSRNLFVRNIAGGIPSELGADLTGDKFIPKWSPDGQTVRFLNFPPDGDAAFHEVSRAGGPVRTITREAYFASDDGMATIVFDSLANTVFLQSSLLDAPIDLSRWPELHSTAWSADGMRLAFVDWNRRWEGMGNIAPSAIWVVDLEGGDTVQVTTAEHLNVSPVWLPDSRHLLFISDRDGSRGVYVVEVGRSGAVGEPRPLAGTVQQPHSISISADGKKLVYSRFNRRINIWSAPFPESSDSLSYADFTQETFGDQTIEAFDVSSDGDWLLFDSDRSGNQDIFKSGRADENPIQLTTDPADDFAPSWSPDGREVAFYSLRSGNREIWVMPSAPGGTPEQLTDNLSSDAVNPHWSPDGLAIAYWVGHSTSTAEIGVWVVRRDSVGSNWGEPEAVTDFPCVFPDFSPSGDAIVCVDADRLVVVDLEGNVVWELKELVFPLAHYSPDGNLVFGNLSADGVRELWLTRLNRGAAPSFLLRHEEILWYRFSRDRIFVNFQKFEGNLYVMDLDWEQ